MVTKMKIKSSLCSDNLKIFYPNLGGIKECRNLGGKPLLQKNYGQANDCTLTCLAFIFGEKYYSDIERIAKTLGYDGEKSGTNPLVIKTLMQKIMHIANVKGTAMSAYGKCVGYNWKTIKRLINDKHYVILNLLDDGRKYYHNHSVSIVGYAEYEKHKFLMIFDNWSSSVSYIDYDKLSMISSINYYI